MALSVLYIFTRNALSSESKEGFEVLMASVAMELQVSVLLINDGIYLLKAEQGDRSADDVLAQTGASHKRFFALPDFDIAPVHVCERSLKGRGLVSDDLGLPIEPCDRDEIAHLIRASDRVLVF